METKYIKSHKQHNSHSVKNLLPKKEGDSLRENKRHKRAKVSSKFPRSPLYRSSSPLQLVEDGESLSRHADALSSEVNTTGSLPKRLHYFFERQCDADPDALALICGTEHLSYGLLDARANRLAHYLARRGIGAGDRVGILLERSVQTYVTLLAVLKCGAAFVPLDPSFPQDRITYIAENAALDLLVTTAKFSDATAGTSCGVLELDTAGAAIAFEPARRITVPDSDDALCYIIYTSGSTGRPKGVAVNHSHICNFIAVCTPIYGVTSCDRVYQGMTIAFDFSIEEIWPTFAAGATIVVGPTDYRRLGSGLTDFLIEQEVTLLCCVPTLLATVDRDVPSLHTLLVGGEACPQDLVQRWSQPGRRMLNTYGPTETTVTALWTELVPDKAVTIGKPLPTYTTYILDDELHPMPTGEAGEICIGGLGVTCGYVNLPELTDAKFVPDPFEQDRYGARLYRSGDLGRVTPSGEIEFLGRIDSQVKIRGYRIELSEIEAVVLESEAVENAIVSVVSGNGTGQELVAYITLSGLTTDTEELKNDLYATLRRRLPSYMVPAFIEILDAIPTMPSGKADRSRLPAPASRRLTARSGTGVPPATPLEKKLATAWGTAFDRDDLCVEDDFFNELGGHSLLAAQVISTLRQNPALNSLSIADLYSYPTIRALARHIEETPLPSLSPDAQMAAKSRPSTRRRAGNLQVSVCGATQMFLLYLVFAFLGTPLALLLSAASGWSPFALLLVGGALIPTAWMFSVLLLPIATKWLLIGRFRPGRYPLWSWYYCRWWLVRKMMTLAPLDYLAGSPLMPIYIRLLGGRIGAGCQINTKELHLPDLIEIGDQVSIGYGVEIQPFLVEDGWLYLAPIRIDSNAYVGTNSVVMLGSQVGWGARLLEQSLVARDQTIPDRETWAGSPPQRLVNTDSVIETMADQKTLSTWSPKLWAGFVAGWLFLEILPSIMTAPGLIFAYATSGGEPLQGLVAAPIAGLLFVLTACALVAALKKLVMPTVRPGIFSVYSSFGLRKWLADKLMMTSLGVTNTLYATLYTTPWLRLLGAKVGPRSEISTVAHIDPELLTLGAESFLADNVAVGPAKYYNGFMALGTTELGTRCFVGNSALVPGSTRLGEGSLIGAHSVPPKKPVEPDTSWLGSPAIFLPRRQKSHCFDETVTFRPPAKLVACRLAIEFLRIVLPPTLMYMLVIPETQVMVQLAGGLSAPLLVAVLPIVYWASALLLTVLVAGLKWLTVGRYRPRVEPMWSNFVWRTELITGLYETVVVPGLLMWFTGTPLMSPVLRLFGARIGRRVYIETTFITEFDLVRVADDAAVGGLTSLQTHLFEDRVMKMSTVKIGRGCTVGPRSVVLYDSVMEPGTKLDALSLLMKSEVLPCESRWRGIPARLVD